MCYVVQFFENKTANYTSMHFLHLHHDRWCSGHNLRSFLVSLGMAYQSGLLFSPRHK